MNLSETILKSALAAIPVAELEYNDWIRVGMALKTSGADCSVWDEWSRADNRFHEGECAKKWKGFNRGEVTAGTIFHIAQEHGWAFPVGEALDWDSEIEFDGYESKIRYKAEGTAQTAQLITFLETLFKPDDIVGYIANVTDIQYTDGKYKPKTIGNFTHTAGELIAELKAHPDDIGAAIGGYNENCGGWIRMNPMDGKGGKDENVLAFRYALVEADTIPVEDQKKKYLEYQLPIAALVYSGGKSMHAVIRIDAKDAEEYKERVEFLFGWLKSNNFPVDDANKNPSRNTRMPGLKRGDQMQKLLGTNLGKASWAEWENYVSDKTKGMADYLQNDFAGDTEKYKNVWKTGLPCIDNGLGGLIAGLNVWGGAPGTGKTTLAWQCADNIVKDGGYVLYFTLEQSYAEMATKSIARYAALEISKKHAFLANKDALSSTDIRRGKSSPLVEQAKEKYIADVGNRMRVISGVFELGVDDIVKTVEEYIRRYHVKPVVFVDYLQILEGDKDQIIRKNVDDSAKKLRKLSLKGFPVVVISSFNRSSYEYIGGFESFKESGGIEYSADVVCTIDLYHIKDFDDWNNKDNTVNNRREYIKHLKNQTPRDIQFQWIKNRAGKTGDCRLNYYPAHDLFEDAEIPF